MAIELKQQQKLTQQLVMTPQLQQAIKLLQLNRLELQTLVQQELQENPVLEEGIETEEPTAAEMTVAIHRAFWFATLVSALAVVSAIRIPAGLPADLVHPDHEPDERPQEAGDRRQEAGGQKAEGREADGESAA